MKRFIGVAILLGGLIMGSASPAFAKTHKLKVTVCHNVGHNPHPDTISVNAVGKLDGGHGYLNLETNVFTPHDSEGHKLDFLLAIGDEEIEDAPSCESEDQDEESDSSSLTVLCFPGVGLGVLVDYDGESHLPDGSFILGNGAVCPLAGENGTDGVDGKDGAVGPQGPAGTDGVTSHTSEVVTQTVTYVGCADGTVVGLGAKCPDGTVSTTTTTAPVAAPSGDLPRTGNGQLLALIGLASIGGGTLLWSLRRRSVA